jgi:hypothetical protein
MEANNDVNLEVKRALITPKKIMKILFLLCIVCVFCPTFLVSCSGKEVEVNAMTAVKGMSMYGETVVKPHPIMLICLILPIAAGIVLFAKKFTEKKVAMITLACTVVDFITWLVFKTSVKKIAEQNYCTMKVTGWFYLNMISLVLIIILSLMVLIEIVQLDTDLIVMFSGGGTQAAVNQVGAAVNQMTNEVNKLVSNITSNAGDKRKDRIGFCSKCGASLTYGSKFCSSCGTKIPENILEKAEKKEEKNM